MRGRKPGSPKVKDLAAGRLRVIDGGAGDAPRTEDVAIDAPEWMKDAHARAEWLRILPELRHRKQFIPLFASELARYCVAFGQYVASIVAMDAAGGPVTKSSKGVDMLSQHWVVANRAHETMVKLAGDLGLNPVAQVRLAGAQLDMFQDARPTGTDANSPGANPFGSFRR